MPRSTISNYSGLSSLTVSSIQKIASRQAKSILDSRGEKKWYVLDISNSSVTVAAPNLTDLTALIVQGDQYNQRNGDQIRLRKLIVNFQSVVNPSATWTGLRVLILRSKGGAQTTGSLMVPHVSSVPAYAAVNTANCEVLMDRHYVVDTYGSNSGPTIQANIPLGEELIQYAAGSTTAKRPLYLLFLSDAASLSASNQGFCVIKYMDI